jgi:hypothetical protein
MLNIQPTDTPTIKAYFDRERATRGTIGGVYQQVKRSLEMEEQLSAAVGEGGELADLGHLHAANIALLQGADVQLRQLFGGVVALIEAMQAGAYAATGSVLFDGVPLPEVEEAE